MLFVDGNNDHVNMGTSTAYAGKLNIETDDNSFNLFLVSTDADANAGPNMKFYRNSGSPADNDIMGNIHFTGRNDNSQDVDYAHIETLATDVSDGAEDGYMNIYVAHAGTKARSRIEMDSTEMVINEGGVDLDFRVESDGNTHMLFVDGGSNFVSMGKNTDDGTTVGHFFGTVGSVNHVRDDNNVMALVRKSGDGDIVSFYKDGAVIGYIGTGNSGDVYIGNDDTGLLFAGGSNAIMPTNKTSLRDDAIDLGHPSYRFDDVYATNGTINTSDRNEKQDIENLSEAEAKVAVRVKSLLKKYKWKNAVAKKGDDARIHFGIIAQDLQDAFTAEGLDAGDYGMFISNTWWEKEISVPAKAADEEKGIDAEDAYTYKEHKDEETEGYTKRTRLGVRYDQVLAFIIAGI
tara:strand:- start:156 stop:1367 length:1212 start_codon:yes stop_codon:yes gene_type:complete